MAELKMVADERKSVWYREPFMYLVLGGPLVVVIASLTTAYIAYKTSDGLVEDDYYARGQAINQTLDREHAAVKHGLKSVVALDDGGRELVVRLSASDGMKLPETLQFSFLHATRSGFDKIMLLPRQVDGTYRSPIPEMQPGRWNLVVAAQDWRLVGSLILPGDNHVEIRPTL
jgi:hypothetical protein